MRYDTPVYFQKLTRGNYNAATGNWEGKSITEEKKYASVQSTRKETAKLVYGQITQGSLTIHLQNHYDGEFDHIRVGETTYDVDRRVPLRTKEAYIVHEVQ